MKPDGLATVFVRNLDYSNGHHEKNQEQNSHVNHQGELKPDFVFLFFESFLKPND